jgi:hypothetical protein
MRELIAKIIIQLLALGSVMATLIGFSMSRKRLSKVLFVLHLTRKGAY